MRSTGMALMCVVLAVAGIAPAGIAAEAPLVAAARAEAIRSTLADINDELKAHGGTWEKWAESLKPYRDDIREAMKGKWPWPAKNGFVFQGAAMQVQFLDSFSDLPEGERPLDSLIHFNRQLKALGIDLIVAIIPAKLTTYPDYIYTPGADGTNRPARAPDDRNVSMAVKRLMKDLLGNDVEVVDLHKAFADFRTKNGDDAPLFYVRDAHYINRGARLCAEKIGERLKRYDFVQAAQKAGSPFTAGKGSRDDGTKADNDLLVIKDAKTGALYTDVPDAPVLACGDSHFLYNDGRGATITAQIAYQIGMPISRITREGLSSSIPLDVAKDGNLKQRRVVIVHFTERMMVPKPGKSKWPFVNLPGTEGLTPKADRSNPETNQRQTLQTTAAPKPAEGAAKAIHATGTIRQVSAAPDAKAPYRHYLIKFYVTDLKDGNGSPLSPADGVVSILAMHNRKILPVAEMKKDQQIQVLLTPWTQVEKLYGRIQAGNVPDVTLELEKQLYWGEMAGQPSLTKEELSGIGEEDSPSQRTSPPGSSAPAPQ